MMLKISRFFYSQILPGYVHAIYANFILQMLGIDNLSDSNIS